MAELIGLSPELDICTRTGFLDFVEIVLIPCFLCIPLIPESLSKLSPSKLGPGDMAEIKGCDLESPNQAALDQLGLKRIFCIG